MTARRLTRLATLGVLAGLTLTPTAAAYAAPAPASAGHAQAGKAQHPAPPKPKPAPVKPKPVRLVQVGGVVTAVDAVAGTLTLRPGSPKQPAVTLTVAATVPVQKDGAVAKLADVAVGDHVSAKASVVGTAFTAVRLQVESPEVESPEPADQA